MAKIIVGTSNPGKVREIASILSPLGHEIIPMALDVDETGKTIQENAIIKALAYSEKNPEYYVIAEDSGLVCPCLNGLPGPYSARFHSTTLAETFENGKYSIEVISIPREDFTTDKTEHDKLNNDKLIEIIKNIPEEQRTGYFEVSFAIAKNGKLIKTFEGKSYGNIITELRGQNGFGYDPIFVGNDTFGKTYAELDSARKNLRSHRKIALKELGLWVAQNIE